MINVYAAVSLVLLFSVHVVAETRRTNGRLTRHSRDLALPPLSHGGAFFTVLVLDRSDSMAEKDYPPCRLAAAKQAATEYVRARSQRCRNDQIAVVSFAGKASVELAWHRPDTHAEKIVRAIESIEIDGSTSVGAGLAEAESLFVGRQLGFWTRLFSNRDSIAAPEIPPGSMRRLIVLSDGGQNMSPDPLPIAQRMRDAGVVIECIGIGARGEVDETYLLKIASTVDGRKRYRFIGDGDARELTEQYRALGGAITR